MRLLYRDTALNPSISFLAAEGGGGGRRSEGGGGGGGGKGAGGMGGETLREGDRVSCPAWLFDEPGAVKEERWSVQTYGRTWRHARVRGVVAGAGG